MEWRWSGNEQALRECEYDEFDIYLSLLIYLSIVLCECISHGIFLTSYIS